MIGRKYKTWSGRGFLAVFRREDAYGNVELVKVPLQFWSQDADGKWIGWVLDKRGPTDAATFSNFSHYERK